MRSLFIVGLLFASGCQFLYFGGDDSDDDYCALSDTKGAPEIAPAALRDPGTLLCQSFGGGPGCDLRCGPCPPQPAIALAPIPSWNTCGHTCEGLAEDACATNAECRVVKHVACAIEGNCLTDFLGCFPTDTAVDPTVSCSTHDAWDCSRSNKCTALHDSTPCGTDAECARAFVMCIPEGSQPGRCFAPVTCERVEPGCPPNSLPGVANGCYTGACIPVEHCEPA